MSTKISIENPQTREIDTIILSPFNDPKALQILRATFLIITRHNAHSKMHMHMHMQDLDKRSIS